MFEAEAEAHRQANAAVGREDDAEYITEEYLNELESEMMAAADGLEFERAAALRDRIMQLRESMGKKVSDVKVESYKPDKSRRRGARRKSAKVPRPKKAP